MSCLNSHAAELCQRWVLDLGVIGFEESFLQYAMLPVGGSSGMTSWRCWHLISTFKEVKDSKKGNGLLLNEIFPTSCPTENLYICSLKLMCVEVPCIHKEVLQWRGRHSQVMSYWHRQRISPSSLPPSLACCPQQSLCPGWEGWGEQQMSRRKGTTGGESPNNSLVTVMTVGLRKNLGGGEREWRKKSVIRKHRKSSIFTESLYLKKMQPPTEIPWGAGTSPVPSKVPNS